MSKTHQNQKSFICDECKQIFLSQRRLIDHIKSNHNENYNQKNKKFRCDWNECQFESKRYSKLESP